jgi:hypothetical protein
MVEVGCVGNDESLAALLHPPEQSRGSGARQPLARLAKWSQPDLLSTLLVALLAISISAEVNLGCVWFAAPLCQTHPYIRSSDACC